MFSDRPPAIVVPDCPEGRAERLSMVAEEPLLMGKVYLCSEFERTKYPVYTDDDLYRPRNLPMCARRKRDGVRDMNLCCRCLSGLPHTFHEKAHETFTDSRVSL